MADENGFPIFKDFDEKKVLKIHTLNSVYLIALVNRKKKLVAIQGGRHFPEPQLVTLTGSSAGIESSYLVIDCAVLGLGLEVWRNFKKYPQPRLVTSPIKLVALAEKPELAEQLRKEAKSLS